MKTRRHAKILELIKEHDIDTQDELLRYLRESGFDVTQATVSRDIKELRLVKTLSRAGKYRYSTGSENISDMSSKFYSLFWGLRPLGRIRPEHAGHPLHGGHGPGGVRLFGLHALAGLCGHAGRDDTIFIVCRTEADAQESQEEFRKLINR